MTIGDRAVEARLRKKCEDRLRQVGRMLNAWEEAVYGQSKQKTNRERMSFPTATEYDGWDEHEEQELKRMDPALRFPRRIASDRQ